MSLLVGLVARNEDTAAQGVKQVSFACVVIRFETVASNEEKCIYQGFKCNHCAVELGVGLDPMLQVLIQPN
jgi:hypothetical protein